MDTSVSYVMKMLNALAEKTGQMFQGKGFDAMAADLAEVVQKKPRIKNTAVDEITRKYLYDLHSKTISAERDGQEFISLHWSKLDTISLFLGYGNFRDFFSQYERQLNPVLESCIGNYYNYVRSSLKEGHLLRSPVRIYISDGKIWYELRGPKWIYKGELELQNGCLFVLLRSEAGKMIHHTYKIGTRREPDVLQGVFSGVSTSFDPIGGRTVLIKVNQSFESLSNSMIKVTASTGAKGVNKGLFTYFRKPEKNNIAIEPVKSFALSDLG